jgi:hypothetical protein
VLAGRAVGVDDPLGKEVFHLIIATRNIGGEYMIEGAVLADEDDHVLDGRFGLLTMGLIFGAGCSR